MKNNTKTKLFRAIAVLLALGVWQFIAMKVNNKMLLASPIEVLKRLLVIWKEPGFLSTIGFSFLRITAGFLLAFAIGILAGAAAGHFQVVESLFWPWVTAIKTVPVASFIILCLIWLSFNRLTILISFLIAFPVIYANVLQGIKSNDEKMNEMCSLFKTSRFHRLIYVTVPSVKPYLLSASGVAVGMAWKAGVAAEVIGMVEGSIGEMLYESKIYFLNADLWCWTLIIILLSVITEKMFLLILKAVFRWEETL